ncbi:EamA family transporter [Geodermatophilus sp. CPCC 206100]|uniref:EamA family transporter n=1 Tax=Geodermatophilus sp. CPCC 206100 TaxID=3020054 RepID=UPI003B0063A3
MGELLAVSALLLFSVNVFLVRSAALRLPQDLGFLLALAGNVACAGVLLAGQYAVGGPQPPLEWDAVGLFAVGGLLTTFLGRWFFFRSVGTIGPTRASALQITNPLFAGLAAWLIIGEALPPSVVLWGLTIMVGLYLTSRRSGGRGEGGGHAEARSIPLPELGLALLGALQYGVGNVARGAAVRDWEAPVFGTLIGATAALLVYALRTADLRKLTSALRGADRRGRHLWIWSGVTTAGAQSCVVAASVHLPVAVVLVIAAAVPVVVLPVSAVFLRRAEGIGLATVCGVLVVLAGVTGLVLG